MQKLDTGQDSFFASKTFFWLLAGGLLLFGAVLIVISFLGSDEDFREARPVPVEVEAVSPYIFADIIEAIGTARANESVELTAQVSDTVKEVHFGDGGQVEEGTIIVTLTNAEELANVSAALASYTEAKQQFDRTTPLVEKGTLSQAALDAATRSLDEARAQLTAARARAGDYVISAPFTGLLGLREVSPGTLVSPGTPITTLDDISIIKVDFSVPEKYLASLSPGQEIVTEAAAYPGRSFLGIVSSVGTRIDPVTRAVTVRAEIPNDEGLLRPGMLLTVDLINNVREALSVPENALIPVGEKQFIFKLSGGEVRRLEIATGGRYGARVEVLSGLSEGDRVVYSGTVNLQDLAPVRVMLDRSPPALPEELLAFLDAETVEAAEAQDDAQGEAEENDSF